MKTPNDNVSRFDGRNHHDSAMQVRRKRVLAAFDCESLEGRKLMTGFTGAGAMMSHGPAEMADIGGGQFGKGDWQGFDAGSAADSSNATPSTATPPTGAPASGVLGGARSSLQKADSQGTNDQVPGFGGAMMGDMGRHSLRGDFQGSGSSTARGDDGAGASDIPMMGRMGGDALGQSFDRNDALSGQAGTDSQGQPSTGNTQLDTDLTKLQTDEQAIQDKSQVTPALLASVGKDNEAIDKAKTGTADATALKTLQIDEKTTFSGDTAPTDAQLTQLQTDRNAVLLSEGVSQTLIDQLATDQLAVKTASNFTDADKATLDADHKAIEADRSSSSSTDSSSSTTATTTSSTATTDTATTATPAVAAASTTTTPTDPTSTSTTSTMDHHGRAGFDHPVSGQAKGVGSSDRFAGDQTDAAGVSFSHSTSFGGRGRDSFRG